MPQRESDGVLPAQKGSKRGRAAEALVLALVRTGVPDDVLPLIVNLVAANGRVQHLMRLACTNCFFRKQVDHLLPQPGRDDRRAVVDLRVCRLWWGRDLDRAIDMLIKLMAQINTVDEARLHQRIEWRPSGGIDNWNLSHLGLHQLPESIGGLMVGMDLCLSYNNLSSLPESFGNLTVGMDLYLNNNNLSSLPESFCNLTVGGRLWLYCNQLTSLPESFGGLRVGRDLWLSYNKLTSLPESFGNLNVGGDLCLRDNQFTSLPESIGGLRVGSDMYLSYNNLSSLPESFGNLTVGRDLYLNNNNLSSLPESFGDLTVGRNLYLSNNNLSESFRNVKGYVRH